MRKRVNISLPEETIKLMDRMTEKGDRSRLIDEAVRYFVREHGKVSLRELVKRGAQARAAENAAMAEEWFPVDESLWQKRKR